MQPYLLLDAGGTLLFPDFALLRRLIREHGPDVDEVRLKRIATEYIRRFDQSLRDPTKTVPFADFWKCILHDAGAANVDIPGILAKIERLDVERSLWANTFPWVRSALERLMQLGYHISVISNADGRVRQDLEYTRLAGYMEQVFDSTIVGYEKPDARIFCQALHVLNQQPEQCLYVGDVYSIDVLGANRVGIAAVHLDPYDLYTDWKGYHIHSVADLPDFLATHGSDLTDAAFFPLRE